MEIIIKRLTPALAEDYLGFFDTTPHSTNKAEHRCYCVCWCSDDGGRDFSTAEKRRCAAAEYVRTGVIQGYLAYADGRPVAWCNANTRADCTRCLSWRMFMGAVPPEAGRTKAVFCFAVAPAYRRQGIAALLLARVCRDAAAEGFAAVEGYPNARFESTESDFMGPAALFARQGFAEAGRAGGRLVMRKPL